MSLTLNQLKFSFFLLSVGWLLAAVVLLIEVSVNFIIVSEPLHHQ